MSLIDPVEPHVDSVTEPDPQSWGWYLSMAAAIVKPYDLPHSTVGGESGELEARVVETNPEAVVVDANHPLAGQDITFSVRVADIRDATGEEMSRQAQLLVH